MQTKPYLMSAIYFMAAVLCGPANAGAKQPENVRIEVGGVGFATPESVEYNAAEEVYLVPRLRRHKKAR